MSIEATSGNVLSCWGSARFESSAARCGAHLHLVHVANDIFQVAIAGLSGELVGHGRRLYAAHGPEGVCPNSAVGSLRIVLDEVGIARLVVHDGGGVGKGERGVVGV